jgi:hypothetical protein
VPADWQSQIRGPSFKKIGRQKVIAVIFQAQLIPGNW